MATDRVKFMASDGLHMNSGIFVYLPVYRKNTSIGDAAQREAAQWLERTAPAPTAIQRLLQSWEQRFKLIEVG